MEEILIDIGRLRKKLNQILNFNKFDYGEKLFEEESYVWLINEEDVEGLIHLLLDVITECERIKREVEERVK